MPQVNGNPEELLAFANALMQFMGNIQAETAALNGHFQALGDNWHDEQRSRFEAEFNGMLAQVTHFQSTCEEFVPYLQNLATRLQDYLRS